ncbi:MAG: ATP-binding protein [Pikeienuella sp.]
MKSWTIKAKLFAAVVPLLLVLLPALTMTSHLRNQAELTAQIDAKLAHLIVGQSLVLSRAIENPEAELLTIIAAGVLTDTDIVHVRIEGPEGNTLLRLGDPSLAEATHRRAIHATGAPAGRLAGTLEIGVSFARANAVLAQGIEEAIVVALVVLAVLLVGGYTAVEVFVTRPLARLQDDIARWRRGDPVAERPEVPDDEIGRVALAFHESQALQRARELEVENVRSELEQRVQARTAELSRARDDAEAANRAKADFLAKMSHEIRTPMNAILGMAQMLAQTAKEPSDAAKIDVILSGGRGLMELLSDILDFSKIDAGRMEISYREENLAAVIEELHALWRPLGQAKGVEVTLSISQDLPARLMFDATRVRQCLSNLLSNAVKFTDRGSVSICVGAWRGGAGEWVVGIGVRDTGIGIPAAELERLGEPFTQIDASSDRRFGGTGLGLAITRRFAEMMGGGLTIESEEGQGSRFKITFLAKAAPASRSPKAVASRSMPSPRMRNYAARRILIVDDVETNRFVARLMLEPTGASLLEASDGRAAIACLETEPVDLVLLDLHMPVLDGMAAIRRIRRLDGARGQVEIIALTADVRPDLRGTLASLGVEGFVAKPVGVDALLAAVDAGLARAARRGALAPARHVALGG